MSLSAALKEAFPGSPLDDVVAAADALESGGIASRATTADEATPGEALDTSVNELIAGLNALLLYLDISPAVLTDADGNVIVDTNGNLIIG